MRTAALALLLVACSSSPAPATTPDAGARDAAIADDAPATSDAAADDAAQPDASVDVDAGSDAGSDAGAPCEVAPNSGCPTGQACYWIRRLSDATYARGCLREGTRAADETCDIAAGVNDCEGGSFCDSGSPSTCVRYCEAFHAAECPSGVCSVRTMFDATHGICAP